MEFPKQLIKADSIFRKGTEINLDFFSDNQSILNLTLLQRHYLGCWASFIDTDIRPKSKTTFDFVEFRFILLVLILNCILYLLV